MIDVTTLGDARPRYIAGYEPPPPAPRRELPALAKCPSCGSREWLDFDGRSICSYCRGER